MTRQVTPVLAGTRQVVTRPGKTGAALGTASAVAALVAARRRRSRPDAIVDPAQPYDRPYDPAQPYDRPYDQD